MARLYGYQYDKTAKNLVIVDSEAESVREAVRRVLAGETVYSLVRDFNRRGVPTISGALWSSTTMHNLLRSARIAGLRSHHGEVVAVGQWEPIITPEEHERLLAVTAKRPGRTRNGRPARFRSWGSCCVASAASRCGPHRERTPPLRMPVLENLGGCGGILISAPAVEGR